MCIQRHSSSFANNLRIAFCLSIVLCTDKKSQHDDDDESGMGPSVSAARKSTMVSEVSYLLPPSLN